MYLRFLILCLCMLLPTASPSAAEAAEPDRTILLVFEDRPNPPLYYGEGTRIDWSKPGLLVELLVMVGEKAGLKFQFKRVPWSRGLFMVKTGIADGIFHTGYTPERARYLLFPMENGEPDPEFALFFQPYSLCVRQDSSISWDGSTLSGLLRPISYTSGYNIEDWLRANEIPSESGRSITSNVNRLLAGKIDGVIDLDENIDSLLASHPRRNELRKIVPPLATEDSYLAFSRYLEKRSPGMTRTLWEMQREVAQSPPFLKIREQYGQIQ